MLYQVASGQWRYSHQINGVISIITVKQTGKKKEKLLTTSEEEEKKGGESLISQND